MIVRALLAGVLVLSLSPPPRAADALHDALDGVQKRYEATRTLTADFKQIVESQTLAAPLESHGKVAFAKPNRMRWDYAKPDEQLVVGDGENLWIYQPAEKQVIKARLGEAFHASTPVTFLAGLGRVDRDFDPSLEREDAERWVLKLVPKNDPGLGTLGLTVRKRDASIEEARITDPLGTTTRLAFSNEERNGKLDPALFRFSPPSGVDVVTPPAY